MRVLVLYDKFSTYTNAVFDHLAAFKDCSRHQHFFAHALSGLRGLSIESFDVLVVHYSVRVAFGAFSVPEKKRISSFKGLKVLFIQDEYDNTETAREVISQCHFDVVFTCVPEPHIHKIYPAHRFNGTKFINTLTGYVNPKSLSERPDFTSSRTIDIGYRGRDLPFWYGDLGQEKTAISLGVIEHFADNGLLLDVSCKDEDRIYGDDWPNFLKKCKATLGTESGCNIFDDFGHIKARVQQYLSENPEASYAEVRGNVSGLGTESLIMNQVSPRLFEAVSYGTVLILFEGNYSGIFKPWIHYIPLKKDFSNVDDVVLKLKDSVYLSRVAEKAYEDIIVSGKYSYDAFISQYDVVLDEHAVEPYAISNPIVSKGKFTDYPERISQIKATGFYRKVWDFLPLGCKKKIKPLVVNTTMVIKGIVRR